MFNWFNNPSKTALSWVGESRIYLPKYISWSEMVWTEETDLLDVNEKQAEAFAGSMVKVVKDFLDPVRNQFGPVMVTSGFRCSSLNKRIGGSPNSQHRLGQAADFNVRDMESRKDRLQIIKWLAEHLSANGMHWGQILLERGCIHVSSYAGGSMNVVADAEGDGKGAWTLKALDIQEEVI